MLGLLVVVYEIPYSSFHFIFNIERSDLRMFACFFSQTCLGVPAVTSFRKKTGKEVVPAETPDYFWPFWWPVVGGDTYSPLAPILDPVKQKWPCHPLSMFVGENMMSKCVTME